MSTRWFNIGVRWLNGNLAQGMRQAGSDFRGMIDGQVRDLRRLETAQRDLARTEIAARRDLEAAEEKIRSRRQKERQENAQRKHDLDVVSARLRELGAERKKLLAEATAGTNKIAALERAEEVRRRQVRLEAKKRKAEALESDASLSRRELATKTVLQQGEAKLAQLVEKVAIARKHGAEVAVAAQNRINAAVAQEARIRRAIREQEQSDRRRGAPVNPAFFQWESEVGALKQTQ